MSKEMRHGRMGVPLVAAAEPIDDRWQPVRAVDSGPVCVWKLVSRSNFGNRYRSGQLIYSAVARCGAPGECLRVENPGRRRSTIYVPDGIKLDRPLRHFEGSIECATWPRTSLIRRASSDL